MIRLVRTFSIFLLLFISTHGNLFSQAHLGMPYNFSYTNGAFTAYTPPTSGLANTSPALTGVNDGTSNVHAPAGFSFNFAGVVYDGFIVSSNGFIVLTKGLANGAAVPAGINSFPANNLATGASVANLPLIAAQWDDLQAGALQWQFNSPNLWVRYTATRWQSANSTGAANNQFYINLNIANGNINIIYPNSAAGYVPVPNSGPNCTGSMGIAGPCAGDFYAIKPTFFSNPDTSWNFGGVVDSISDPQDYLQRRPNNMYFTFVPRIPVNDNCAGAINLGALSPICSYQQFTNVFATASAAGNVSCSPSGTDNNDVWFYVVKPTGVSDIRFTTASLGCSFTNGLSGTSIEVFASCGGASLGCSTSNGASTYGMVEVYGRNPCIAETLYVRVTGDGNTAGKFNICARDISSVAGGSCATPRYLCSLPQTLPGLTTFGLLVDSANSACQDPFLNGQDYIFAYTPPVNQCIRVSVYNAGTNPGVFVMDGCPGYPANYCLASATAASGAATINSVSLVAGQTYYIIVSNNSANAAMPFDISVTALGTTQSNDDCANATNLGNINFGQTCVWSANYSTECSTPSPLSGYPDPGCAGFIQGSGPTNSITGDVWFRFTAQFNGSILIDSRYGSANSMTEGGMAVYVGSCGVFTLIGCDASSGSSPGMPSLSVLATSGVTYYVRVWATNPTTTGTFQLCISTCSVPNETPCQAIALNLGTPVLGNNTCSNNAGEPPTPACWGTTGTVNTVWYSAVVPASGRLKIKASLISNTDTQIAAYLFPSGCANASTTYNLVNCNDNTAGCPCGGADYGSQLDLTGLTPGQTIYIAVDGRNSIVGSFFITAIDGNNSFPPLYGQDCGGAISVCNNAPLDVTSPSIGVGNMCDNNGNLSGCFSCGERSGVWYTFTVAGGSTFQFTLTPKAYTPTANFDFAIWDVTANPTNPCALVLNTPVRCNNAGASGSGATGLSSAGGTGFSTPITVATTTTFILAFRNWNHTPVGYNIDWMGSNIIPPANPILTWNGSVDTNFATGANYNCFSSFGCTRDVQIPFGGGVPFQPTINSNQTIHNLTIFAGAQLRIKSGVTLQLCGSLNAFGTLIAENGSTIEFINNEVQSINGSAAGTNALANMTVNKTGGTLTANTALDIKQNYLSSNVNSILNINNQYMKVGGNFTNSTGNTTFTNYSNSTVEFNGTANQYFTNNSGQLTLAKVVMNKASNKLYLNGVNSNMNVDSSLAMNGGLIVTRLQPFTEVNIKNNAATSLTGYNSTRYIDGRLRRKVYAGSALSFPFSIDFPVGDSTNSKFYQLANVTFTSATVVSDLLAYFTAWPGAAPAMGPTASECLIATYDALPIFNNGYWTLTRGTSGGSNGTYRFTANNTNYSNNSGMGWTVATTPDTTVNPSAVASWGLIGNCVISSTANVTQRDGINTPPNFNRRYATVQSTQPLPIELLFFQAKKEGFEVVCKWATASETNNEYFVVERSLDAENFSPIGSVQGYGPGTSTQTLYYSLTDKDPCESTHYYRLKQVDIDGAFSYSPVVAVRCSKDLQEINLSPNPASNQVMVSFYEASEGPVNLQFIDYTGRTVFESNFNAIKGYNSFDLNISGLSKGMYYVILKSLQGADTDVPRQIRFLKN